MLSTLKFVAGHPLNRRRPVAALMRYAAWQVRSRIRTECLHPWIGGTQLVVRYGMTGATGNIYCGLHEFAEMAFVMHVLKTNDVFLDVGANIGSYTVLASGVCGAQTIAFEPDPRSADNLRRNIQVNQLDGLVEVHEVALGNTTGETVFTVGLDTGNRIARPGDRSTQTVPMCRLDDIPGAYKAAVIKIDVEGYEAEVLAGGRGVLASPTVIAVETEWPGAATWAALTAAGFVGRWYDPWSRTLSQVEPDNWKASNVLFVRDEASVLARVQAAPSRRIQDQDL